MALCVTKHPRNKSWLLQFGLSDSKPLLGWQATSWSDWRRRQSQTRVKTGEYGRRRETESAWRRKSSEIATRSDCRRRRSQIRVRLEKPTYRPLLLLPQFFPWLWSSFAWQQKFAETSHHGHHSSSYTVSFIQSPSSRRD